MNAMSPGNLVRTHRERKINNKLRNRIAKQHEKVGDFRRMNKELRKQLKAVRIKSRRK